MISRSGTENMEYNLLIRGKKIKKQLMLRGKKYIKRRRKSSIFQYLLAIVHPERDIKDEVKNGMPTWCLKLEVLQMQI